MTRGAVQAEGVEGGFSATYRVLAAFEDNGQARRGYVVEGLGAAQFAMDGAVDRLRAASTARDRRDPDTAPQALVTLDSLTRPTRTARPCRGRSPRTAPDTNRAAKRGRWWSWSTVS
ncbi:hypothetical protein SFIMM107S_07337 [Streptomyces griseus]